MLGAVLIGVLLELAARSRATRASLFYRVIVVGSRLIVKVRSIAKLAASCIGGDARLRASSSTPSSERDRSRLGRRRGAERRRRRLQWSTLGRRSRVPRADLEVTPVCVHLVGRAGARPDALAGLGANRSLLVPMLYLAAFVWENVMLDEAEHHAVHHPRVVADRADDLPSLTGCSARSAWRSSRWREKLLELRDVSMAFGGLRVIDEPRPRMSTRARSSA